MFFFIWIILLSNDSNYLSICFVCVSFVEFVFGESLLLIQRIDETTHIHTHTLYKTESPFYINIKKVYVLFCVW